MRASLLSALAWCAGAGVLLLLAGGVALEAALRGATLPPEAMVWPAPLFPLLCFASATVVGTLIAARMPRNPYGWLWLLCSLGFGGLQGFFSPYALASSHLVHGGLPLEGLAVAAADLGWAVGISAFPFLLLLFPTGRPAGGFGRIVVIVSVFSALLLLATGWAVPGASGVVPGAEAPFGITGPVGDAVETIQFVAVFALFGCILAGAVSLLLRLRSSAGTERQQLKWLAYAAAVLSVTVLAGFFYEPPGLWKPAADSLSFMLLPLAVGIAMFRYRLYEIDRIINRTLVYALLTAVLGAIYYGMVVALQGAFRAVTTSESELAVVLSTLTVAALFTPLRRRLQGLIDRAFYRSAYDSRLALSRLGATLRSEVELEPLLDATLRTVTLTVQPSHLSLWLPSGSRDDSETGRR